MIVSPNTQHTTVLLQGFRVEVPILVSEETLSASEPALAAVGIPLSAAAAMLQQVLVENLVNNTSAAVKGLIKKALEEAGTSDWDEKIRSLSDEQKEIISAGMDRSALQAIVDKYIREYTPGVRRAPAGEPIDPVESAALRLALVSVKDKLERTPFSWESTTYQGVGRNAKAASFQAFNALCESRYNMGAADFILAKAQEAVEAVPFFREQARIQIAGAAKATEDLALSI